MTMPKTEPDKLSTDKALVQAPLWVHTLECGQGAKGEVPLVHSGPDPPLGSKTCKTWTLLQTYILHTWKQLGSCSRVTPQLQVETVSPSKSKTRGSLPAWHLALKTPIKINASVLLGESVAQVAVNALVLLQVARPHTKQFSLEICLLEKIFNIGSIAFKKWLLTNGSHSLKSFTAPVSSGRTSGLDLTAFCFGWASLPVWDLRLAILKMEKLCA